MRSCVVAISLVSMFLLVMGCSGNPFGASTNQAEAAAQPSTQTKAAQPAKTAAPVKKAAPAQKPAAAKPAPKPAPPKEFTVLKSWDFTKQPTDQWEWRFQDDAKVQTPRGAMTECGEDGSCLVALYGQKLDPQKILGIMVECDGGSAPGAQDVEGVAVFWAHPGDYKEGAWPFDKARSTGLNRSNPKAPNLFSAKFEGCPEWKGTISDIGLRIVLPKLPANAPKPNGRCIVVKSISLIAK